MSISMGTWQEITCDMNKVNNAQNSALLFPICNQQVIKEGRALLQRIIQCVICCVSKWLLIFGLRDINLITLYNPQCYYQTCNE